MAGHAAQQGERTTGMDQFLHFSAFVVMAALLAVV
jgi:hypothetical protein